MVNIPDILQRRKSEKYFRSQPVYEQPVAKVDREAGIIQGVQIVREGEAKGHGVHLDADFISKISEFGNGAKHGVKSRFNHPNMSAGALGTMIGTFHNFSVNGTAAYADLHLSETAKTSPQGNLYDYVLDLAANEPEHFGNSIAFSDDGNLYVKNKDGEKLPLHFQYTDWDLTIRVQDGDELKDYDLDEYSEELYVLPAALHASDLVDDPAATDGLFSTQLNQKAFAVQATQWLDANPEIWDFVEKHPDRLRPFFDKYQAYQARKKQAPTTNQHSTKMKKKPNLFQRLFAAFRSGGTFDISVTDTDGNQLSIVTDSDQPAVGDAVTVIDENGETQPAADGNYVVASGELEGQTITVAEGQIADITDPADDPADETNRPTDPTPDEVSMSAQQLQLTALQEQVSALQAENERLRQQPAASHTSVDDEIDFTAGTPPKMYSFNVAGRKAYEQGQQIRQIKEAAAPAK